jgi:hypothetical protein
LFGRLFREPAGDCCSAGKIPRVSHKLSFICND